MVKMIFVVLGVCVVIASMILDDIRLMGVGILLLNAAWNITDSLWTTFKALDKEPS